jgi:hypothetical protein
VAADLGMQKTLMGGDMGLSGELPGSLASLDVPRWWWWSSLTMTCRGGGGGGCLSWWCGG